MTTKISKISEIQHHTGEHTIAGIRFKPARQAMGVSAWGMNVIEFDPRCDGYPEHDHKHDGQEELYVVLEGSIVLIADGSETVIEKGTLVRVAPESRRKFVTREHGATLLALGATPGKAYAPDPRMG